MPGLSQIIRNYSVKYEKKLKQLCEPLLDELSIPVFTYSFVGADGRFGFLTNTLDFNSYYFEAELHLQNPYFAHPTLFRSGYAMLPCSLDEETQKILSRRFEADHFFLCLDSNPMQVEAFIFANPNENLQHSQFYLSHLELINKFCRYFKREAENLIEKMKADQYNIKSERGIELFESVPQVPLTAYDSKAQNFLKKIYGLSQQELICLEYFKQGKSAQATGAMMNLSQRTVESYFESIKNKLGCSSKYDLLNF